MTTELTKIIAIVDSYISLCTLIVTEDYSDYKKHIFDYRKRWDAIMAYETKFDLPLWIQHSPSVSNAHSAIKLECGTGNGAWERRRVFLNETRNQLIRSYRKNRASKVSSSSAVNLADYNPKSNVDFNIPGITDKDRKLASMKQGVPSTRIAETIAEVVKNPQANYKTRGTPVQKKKIFIVHGHDEKLKYEVFQFLSEQGFEPIILHHQTNDGDTIIEKLERHFNDLVYAVVLYTACDEGKAKSEHTYKLRARQNVVFEHGYLLSKLGRQNVTAILSDGVEAPGDVTGVVYLKESTDWRYSLSKELEKHKN